MSNEVAQFQCAEHALTRFTAGTNMLHMNTNTTGRVILPHSPNVRRVENTGIRLRRDS